MADVTAPQFQQVVNDAVEWANGDENTTVTMQSGQQARSPAKVINDIQNQADTAIDEINRSRGFRRVGTFSSGFTYELANDVGIDANGDAWVYTDIDALPVVVSAGTLPSEPTYTAVVFSDAENVNMDNGNTVEDEIYNVENRTLEGDVFKGSNGLGLSQGDTIPTGYRYILVNVSGEQLILTNWDAVNYPQIFDAITENSSEGYDVTMSSGTYEYVRKDIFRLRGGTGGSAFGTGYGIPKGANQGNLSDFQAIFQQRVNPDPVFGGFIGINNPDCGSVFDLASFGGQGIPGFNPIGFVYHHYSDSRMIQIDNVGSNNEILYLKNANNPTRRADQASDYIGSGKFISANRQESDGAGGVTGTLEGFYLSKDFELVWPMQATGINTVTLWNNAPASSEFWTHELKNSNRQRYLLRLNNDGNNDFTVEYVAAASSTNLAAPENMQIKATAGDLRLGAGGTVILDNVLRLDVFASGTLPALSTANRGCIAYVDDGGGAGNRFPAHWDGTNWLRFSDNTIL